MGSSDSFDVAGKTAIVTGAGSGINFEFAALLLSKGCNVVLADISLRPEAEELVAKYAPNEKNPRAVFVKTDVTSWPELGNMFQTALTEFGDYDIVCPGAGVYEPHWSNFWHPPGSPESKDDPNSGHYAILDINLTHPIRTTQIALEHWIHQAREASPSNAAEASGTPKKLRRIVHISSIAGQIPVFSAPMYGASKFAISGFVRCLAPLEDEHGIRVNAVAPGVVRTPLWTEHPEKLISIDPEQDKWVTPHEVAEAMLNCVESTAHPAGTILEVGKDCTRHVEVFNDPGPERDSKKGLITSNYIEGFKQVFRWLQDPKIWGFTKASPSTL